MKFLILFYVFFGAVPTFAEDFPGGSSEEIQKGFDSQTGMSVSDEAKLEQDRLKIGGTLWSDFSYFQLKTPTQSGGFLSNPNTLWTYFDARLMNDVRAFVRFRAIYDPTASSSVISPFTGQVSREIRTILDELKLQFQLKKKVFFTIGRQKIRWGTGKIWNPTDVLNNQRFDFRFGQDVRPGVAMIKTHVPVGASNLYLIQQLEGANQLKSIQHAVRAEVPVGSAEVGGMVLLGAQKKPIFGFDASAGIWDFDLYGEVAHSQGARQTFVGPLGPYSDPDRSWTSGTVGVSYDVKYSDSDLITFGAEYFHNGLGYSTNEFYVPILLSGLYQPFLLGRNYGLLMILLPAPGSLNRTDFSLFNLVNISDKTGLIRFDVTTRVLQGMRVTAAVGAHYGSPSGELRLGGQLVDATLRLVADF